MNTILKIFKYPLIIVFIVIISLPSINSSIGIWNFERKDENRAFTDSLEFNFANIQEFPGYFEDYLNDNFSFRRPLLDLFHNLKFTTFKVSPHPERTIIGHDGWFFMAGKEKDIYEGRMKLTDNDLEKYMYEWEFRAKYLDSLGIKYYWLIGPMKHYVYSEYLPFNVYRNSYKRVEKLKNYLDWSFPGLIVDPLPMLLEAKNKHKLYYKLDNHWNYYAGYLVSELLLSNIKKDFPDKDISDIRNYEWTDSIFQRGIHYRVLCVEDLVEEDRYPIKEKEKAVLAKKYGFPPKKGFAYAYKYERRFINKDTSSDLTILIIRDSFGDQIEPFIKESFHESVFIFDSWSYKLNKEIIAVVKPDIVVFISYEVHIESFITIGKSTVQN